MVCLGNICRSPVAEGILRHKAEQKKLNITVDSAGTAGYHIGETPDNRSVKNAKKHGVDISKLRARQFTISDFDRFDKIFVMDSSNYEDVASIARNKSDLEKVDLILNLTHPGSGKPVPDPYYGGEKGFDEVFRLLDEACGKLIDDLLQIK